MSKTLIITPNSKIRLKDISAEPPKGMTKVYQSVVESFVDRFDGSYNDVMADEAAKQKRQ